MRLYFLLAAVTTLFACNKETALTPNPVKPPYSLPQGNHGYDDTIVDCYKKYSTYILYKFTQDDYSYDYSARKEDSAFNANPAYIGLALRFFKTQLLDVYPENFIRKTMPFKVLLASYIGSGDTRSVKGFESTSSALTIGWADSTLANKTPAQLKQIRSWMHRYYFERAYRVKTIKAPDAFIALAPRLYGDVNEENKYRLGVLAPHGNSLNQGTDFLAYLEAITGNTKAQLQAGVLSPQIDTQGLIKKKYDIVINYFLTEFNVDLQAIGEMP